jgi:DNA end-binding protein Ku
MAPRSFWKGYLKLSLVTCPVAMMPATTESEKVRFHTLNRATGHRVRSRYVDAETGEPVDPDNAVKAYPAAEDRYVILEEDEIARVGLESTHTIDIETFVPDDSIDWIWYDKPHYLVPDEPVGEEAFSVIRAAMAATGTAGISRLVLYRRERAVLLRPRDRGLVLWTLRYGDELRGPEPYFADIGNDDVDRNLLALLEKLIEARVKPWDPGMVADPVQKKWLEVIAAKKKGERPAGKRSAAEPPPHNVVSIMDALRRSIASEPKRPRK